MNKELNYESHFLKFNLRAKLMSLKTDKKERMKNKNRVKRKGKNSSKSVPQSNNKIENKGE